MQVEPLRGESSRCLEGTALLETRCRSIYHLEPALAVHTPVRPSVEGESLDISASDDQQCRCFHFVHRYAGEVGVPSSQNNCVYKIRPARRCNQRGRGTHARAVVADGERSSFLFLFDPSCSAKQ